MEISRYEFGRVLIGERQYTTDVIVSAEHVVDHWRRRQGHRLDPEDLDTALAEHPDVLIVGTGYFGRLEVPDSTRRYLEQRGIELHTADTTSAVEAFNQLQRRQGQIVAALHLTC